jgi:glycosyltransferase involved in cell wall biosynthesis
VPNAKFIIVGDGPSLGSLKDLVKELRITDHVIFTGWVPYQRIPEYLGICDVGVVMRSGVLANNFVLTTALLQLWACGKPVVAPNLGAISQVVMHGENGLLFKPDDPEDLAEKIVYLIMNPNMARKFREEGIMLARKKFDCKVIGEKFVIIIESYARKEIKKQVVRSRGL